jgi:hypothetical protein
MAKMAVVFKSRIDCCFYTYYSVVMVEIFEIFWASPIELRVIIIGIPIVFILLAYLGISGTNEAIDFQNRLWKEEQWRKRNNK